MEKNLSCLTGDEIFERADQKSLEVAKTVVNSTLGNLIHTLKKYQDTGGFIGCVEDSETNQRLAWVAVLRINQLYNDAEDFVHNYR